MKSIRSRYSKIPWEIKYRVPLILVFGTTAAFHYILQLPPLELVGCFVIVGLNFVYGFSLIRFIYENWLAEILGHKTDLKSLGSWAVVTGCTTGIGKAYAHAFSKIGINIVLISRFEAELFAVMQEIRELYGNSIEIKAFPVNFARGEEVYSELQNQLQDLDIGILINNEKMLSHPNFEYFIDLPDADNQFIEMLNCNILSVTRMTGIVLPKMLEKGKGVIVNVGSIRSKIDSPFMALYGSTNAFVEKFTTDMAQEYKDKGIIFQSVTPGSIVSNTEKLEVSTVFFPTSEEFVNKALRTIGIQTQTSGWVSHQLIDGSCDLVSFTCGRISSEAATMTFKQLWLNGKRKLHKKGTTEATCEVRD